MIQQGQVSPECWDAIRQAIAGTCTSQRCSRGMRFLLMAVLAIAVAATATGGNRETLDSATAKASSQPIGGGTGRIAYSCEIDYSRYRLDICVSDLSGTNRVRLTKSRSNEFDPSWSPNGRRIAFRVAPSGLPATTPLADIVVINADGSGRKNLTDNPRRGNWSPAWSPNGRQVAFATARTGTDVWVMRSDGSHLKRLTRGGGEYPAWSPDGKQIAFMSSRTGDYEIYVMTADGTRVRRLTQSAGQDGWPAWSPDGRWIAFTPERGRATGLFDIYVMRPDGSDLRNLTRDTDDLSSDYPDWAPDGSTILFSAYHQDRDGGGIYLMKADGGERRQLIKGGVSPVWQPRARR